VVRRTDPDRVVNDVAEVPDVYPAVRDRIVADPAAAAARLADTLHAYWQLVLAPHWPRMRALLDADVLWRARRLADGGAQLLFADLHETLAWHGDRLTAEGRCDYSGDLSGTGLLLAPSAMAWPVVRTMLEPYQPTVIYPARAVGTLWETGRPSTGDALSGLLGRSRAALLLALSEPASTTAMARRLQLTPGGVSQHLSVLLANGLVTRARVGGSVLYHRTSRGDSLVSEG
jgi:DNA-binding transcriptional ArsR family regulator